ncbi:hypothetical protein [Collinsella sp. An268]|uniref:hypothetical protein n=1 Tax=Collinsella sp. An268 TaxID=1965612 RepID=UPI000B3722F0|nr:hypothetical protein [Collinsella sp. An268]OUO65025.1 hypothetical protein B5F70_02935 [Collinsella sp. An268]
MASQYGRPRAIAAGLACGASVAVPALAYAATLPFEEVHALVASCALPVAAGALAGTGVTALATHIALGRAARIEAEGRAASQASFEEAPSFLRDEGADAASERFFGGRRAPKGVPVIARAQGAPSEAEAWAEIDSLLDDSSPISCDPRYSKDIYQIALEELRQGATHAGATHAGAAAGAAATATAAASTAPATASSETTATVGVSPDTAATTASLAASEEEGAQVVDTGFDGDTDAARLAALASLDTYEGESLVAASAGVSASREPLSVIAAPQQAAPAVSAATSAPVAGDVPSEPVAMRDYSGHEDMWAAALAILDELEAEPEPAYRGKHMRPASLTQPTAVPPSPERAAAVDEGARATERHSHVNALIEEEFEHVPSKSVRRTSREYLSVIQGGTASLPRMRAEA